jgi:hypothetical protein
MEQQWKYSFFQSIRFLVATPIHEQILCPRVSMIIAIKQYISAFQCFLHHHLHREVLGTQLSTRINPLPVQIQSRQRAPVIAYNHSIWIQHWHNLKYEMVP